MTVSVWLVLLQHSTGETRYRWCADTESYHLECRYFRPFPVPRGCFWASLGEAVTMEEARRICKEHKERVAQVEKRFDPSRCL